MIRFLLICLGGAVGTGFRYLIGIWALRDLGPSFPFGTLLVNVIGSFLMGVFVELSGHSSIISPDARSILVTGVLGGFTTYSSFNAEMVAFLREGPASMALLYAGGTLMACLLAGFVGMLVARAVVPA